MSAEASQQPDGGTNKSPSVTLVFVSPDKLCSVLCPFAATWPVSQPEERMELMDFSQLGQLTKVVSPTFGLTPCPFLAHSGLFLST